MRNRLLDETKNSLIRILGDWVWSITTAIAVHANLACKEMKEERDFWRDKFQTAQTMNLGMAEHITILEKKIDILKKGENNE